jgi:hypothetical protein
MWTLLLVTAINTAPAPVGTFATQKACQTSAKEWQVQGVKAGCVQQPSTEDAMKQAIAMMNAFINSMPK